MNDKQRSEHAKRVAKDCYDAAKRMMGAGWAHVSEDIRRDIVMSRVLQVMRNQDESIDARAILDFTRLIADEADAILNRSRANNS